MFSKIGIRFSQVKITGLLYIYLIYIITYLFLNQFINEIKGLHRFVISKKRIINCKYV